MKGKMIGLIPSGPGDFFALKPVNALLTLFVYPVIVSPHQLCEFNNFAIIMIWIFSSSVTWVVLSH